MSQRRANSLIVVAALVGGFFTAAGSSVLALSRAALGKRVPPLRENRFLDALNFVLKIGPRGFWRRPSGIRIGRSLSTLLHYVFFKDASFRRK